MWSMIVSRGSSVCCLSGPTRLSAEAMPLSLSFSFPISQDAQHQRHIHLIGHRGVMEHRAAAAGLSCPADFATGRSDVVEWSVPGVDSEGSQCVHHPGIKEGDDSGKRGP